MDLVNESINIDLNNKVLKEMLFLYNALDNGWSIKKRKELYIFSKKHNNKKEVYNNEYLQRFVDENSVIKSKLLKLNEELK